MTRSNWIMSFCNFFWKSKILVFYTISKFPNAVKVFLWDYLFWKYTRLVSQVAFIYTVFQDSDRWIKSVCVLDLGFEKAPSKVHVTGCLLSLHSKLSTFFNFFGGQQLPRSLVGESDYEDDNDDKNHHHCYCYHNESYYENNDNDDDETI